MNKFFWTIVALETIALASLFVAQWNAPSESGGREMGLFFGVMLPFVLIACASLVYWRANSMLMKSIAFAVAAAPALILAFAWARNFALDKEVANATVNAFHDPDQRALAKAIMGGNAAKVAQLAGRVKLNEPGLQQLTESDYTLLTLALAEKKPETTESNQPKRLDDTAGAGDHASATGPRDSVTRRGRRSQPPSSQRRRGVSRGHQLSGWWHPSANARPWC